MIPIFKSHCHRKKVLRLPVGTELFLSLTHPSTSLNAALASQKPRQVSRISGFLPRTQHHEADISLFTTILTGSQKCKAEPRRETLLISKWLSYVRYYLPSLLRPLLTIYRCGQVQDRNRSLWACGHRRSLRRGNIYEIENIFMSENLGSEFRDFKTTQGFISTLHQINASIESCHSPSSTSLAWKHYLSTPAVHHT